MSSHDDERRRRSGRPLWLVEGLDIVEQRRGPLLGAVAFVVLIPTALAVFAPSIVPPTPVVGAAVGIAALLLGIAAALAADTTDLIVRGPRHVGAAGGELVAILPTDATTSAAQALASSVLEAREPGTQMLLGIAGAGRESAETAAWTDALAVALVQHGGVSCLRIDLASGRTSQPGLAEVVKGEIKLTRAVDIAPGMDLARLGTGDDPIRALRALPSLPGRLPADLDVLLVALPSATNREVVGASQALDNMLVMAHRDSTSRVQLIAALDALDATGTNPQVVLVDDRTAARLGATPVDELAEPVPRPVVADDLAEPADLHGPSDLASGAAEPSDVAAPQPPLAVRDPGAADDLDEVGVPPPGDEGHAARPPDDEDEAVGAADDGQPSDAPEGERAATGDGGAAASGISGVTGVGGGAVAAADLAGKLGAAGASAAGAAAAGAAAEVGAPGTAADTDAEEGAALDDGPSAPLAEWEQPWTIEEDDPTAGAAEGGVEADPDQAADDVAARDEAEVADADLETEPEATVATPGPVGAPVDAGDPNATRPLLLGLLGLEDDEDLLLRGAAERQAAATEDQPAEHTLTDGAPEDGPADEPAASAAAVDTAEWERPWADDAEADGGDAAATAGVGPAEPATDGSATDGPATAAPADQAEPAAEWERPWASDLEETAEEPLHLPPPDAASRVGQPAVVDPLPSSEDTPPPSEPRGVDVLLGAQEAAALAMTEAESEGHDAPDVTTTPDGDDRAVTDPPPASAAPPAADLEPGPPVRDDDFSPPPAIRIPDEYLPQMPSTPAPAAGPQAPGPRTPARPADAAGYATPAPSRPAAGQGRTVGREESTDELPAARRPDPVRPAESDQDELLRTTARLAVLMDDLDVRARGHDDGGRQAP